MLSMMPRTAHLLASQSDGTTNWAPASALATSRASQRDPLAPKLTLLTFARTHSPFLFICFFALFIALSLTLSRALGTLPKDAIAHSLGVVSALYSSVRTVLFALFLMLGS